MGVRLAVIGGGKMGEALVTGLLSSAWAPAGEMAVVEKVEARRRQLAEHLDGVHVHAEPVAAEGAVIAVKPSDVRAACAELRPAGVSRVVSIAAGVRLEQLEEWLGPDVAVVRAMPNTPALVGQGAAAIAAGRMAGDDDLDWAEGVLSAVGTVVRVPEQLLDAVTGLSGSGPAYVFLVAEALMAAGQACGLPAQTSTALVVQTLSGSARLLAESGQPPEALRAAVTSPGGTTEAGLAVLEARAVRAAFVEAVQAATERSRELGQALP